MINEILNQLPVGGEFSIREACFPKGDPFIVVTVAVPSKKYKISHPAIYKKDITDEKVVTAMTELIYLYNKSGPL